MLRPLMRSGQARPARVVATIALVVPALMLGVVVPIGDVARADHDGPEAAQAAAEIQAARDRASQAAQALFDAQSEIDQLAVDIAGTEQRLAEVETEVGDMRDSLGESALRMFMAGGARSNPFLSSVNSVNDEIFASEVAGVATGSGLFAVDELDDTIDELADLGQQLEQQQARANAAEEQFTQLRANAEAEIVRLQEVEALRVEDAEVQHALERERERRAAAERAAAERAAEEAAARAAAAVPVSGGGGSGGGGSGGGSSSGGSSSGGSGGSTTPSGGSNTPVVVSGPGIACPVAGPSGFADTWGAPRSGGRSHKGVDMIASTGTPLVAAESGTALFKTNRLGGNAVWITGNSGARYYYAHLSRWEGSSRSVSKGEVIGYVGATGNASVPHLHFEVHPGGFAVNPYPYVRRAC